MKAISVMMLTGLGLLVPIPSHAESRTSTVNVESGKPARIRSVFNCKHDNFDIWPHGAQHGTTEVTTYTNGLGC